MKELWNLKKPAQLFLPFNIYLLNYLLKEKKNGSTTPKDTQFSWHTQSQTTANNVANIHKNMYRVMILYPPCFFGL